MSGVTVVVPCYNEGAQVETAWRELTAALADVDELEILFVDDGSTDDTLEHIKRASAADPRVTYLSFTRNFGLEAAHSAGFRYARMPWCAQIDADLQASPKEILTLLAKAAEGYDVVFGVRRDRRDPWPRRIGAVGAQWVARRLLKIEVPPGASTFRVVRTTVARTVVDLRLGTPYFLATVALLGARYALVPTAHRERESGGSKFRISRLAGHAFELFFGYSWRPLNAVYLTAAAGTVFAALMTVLAVSGQVSTLTAAMAAVLLTAANLGAVALVGRYLHRLLRDVARIRPYYIREGNIELRPEDTIDAAGPRPGPAARPATPVAS